MIKIVIFAENIITILQKGVNMKRSIILFLLLFSYFLFATENGISNYSILKKDGSVQLLQNEISNNPIFFNNNRLNSLAFADNINKSISPLPINDDNIEQICKSFIAKCRPDINAANLKLLSAKLRNNQWYVNFSQTHNGIQLLNSNTKLRIFKNGNLLDITAAYYDNVNVEYMPNVDTHAIKTAAISGLDIDEKYLIFEFGEQYILPVQNGNGYIYKLVNKVEFRNNIGTIGYLAFVDVKDGKLLLRHNQVHNHDYKVQSQVVETHPNAPLITTDYFPYMQVEVNGKAYDADKNGIITTSDDLNGKQAQIKFRTRQNIVVTPLEMQLASWDGVDWNGNDIPINIKASIQNGIIENAKDTIYRVMATHWNSFYKMNDKFITIDKDFDYLNKRYSIKYLLLDNNASSSDYIVNASSAGASITFYHPLHSNIRIGQMPSVFYHELGHSINDYIYQDCGEMMMFDMALHEGLADVHSAIMLGYSDVFRGLKTDGTSHPSERNLKNTLKLGIDDTGEGHFDGQILSGAMWDLADMITMDTVAKLMHFTRFAIPDGMTTPKAFTNWFIQMLMTDDNDGNLSNGTPNYEEILTAFDNHNIGFNAYMQYNYEHIPLENTNNTTIPYHVELTIPFVNSIKQVDDVWLHYSTSHNVIDSIKMYKFGDTYEAYIPNQIKGTAVKYSFEVYSPFNSKFFNLHPYSETHTFLVDFDTLYTDACGSMNNHITHTIQGAEWQLGTIGEEHLNFQYYSPKEHMPNNICWYINDYENTQGKVTIADLIFPNLQVNNNNICWIELYFYYGIDYMDLDYEDTELNDVEPTSQLIFSISKDNGATWKDVQAYDALTGYSYSFQGSWEKLSFLVNDYFDNTEHYTGIKLRIRAIGETGALKKYSAYAACIDDVTVLVDDIGNVGIEEPTIIKKYSLFPNPASDNCTLSMDLTESSNISINISDMSGKNIMQIYDGYADIGLFSKQFNTKTLSSGMYSVVVKIGDKVKVEKLIINR